MPNKCTEMKIHILAYVVIISQRNKQLMRKGYDLKIPPEESEPEAHVTEVCLPGTVRSEA